MNGIKHLITAPYHPASNGLAERAVQTLKTGLKKVTLKINLLIFSSSIESPPTQPQDRAQLSY